MARMNTRIRIDQQGHLEIVDPGFDSVDLLRSVDPSFRVRRSKLVGFTSPVFLESREVTCGITAQELRALPEETLWRSHNALMNRRRNRETSRERKKDEASLLDLKIELASRILRYCTLCENRCGVDRTRGQMGICRLGTEATVAEHFVHIAEEAPINPSLVLNLAGCGLRCRFCQQNTLLNPSEVEGERLEPSLWPKLEAKGARSLSLVGGNPDESLYAILRFLAAAPKGWKLPIVWNCHGYSTPETLQLLRGVVDVYVVDFKYSSEECGRRWSAVRDYPKTVRSAIAAMLGQDALVIVRILVLPGHFKCCHEPALEYLVTVHSESLLVSVRGQYCPDWRITPRDGELMRRINAEEARSVSTKARAIGLTVVE